MEAWGQAWYHTAQMGDFGPLTDVVTAKCEFPRLPSFGMCCSLPAGRRSGGLYRPVSGACFPTKSEFARRVGPPRLLPTSFLFLCGR